MLLDSGWAVELKDGKISKVENLATAKWLVANGYAQRIWDSILNTPVK